MLRIKIICVGKMKEKHYIAAFSEYEKRLKPYCNFEVCELPEQKLSQSPSDSEISAALKREAADIARNIPNGAFVIPMCIEGQQLSSSELSSTILVHSSAGKSCFCFIIGSSNGLDEGIKKSSDLRLSMSRMTFPHHLARVMLAEQIYRAIMINEGSKYHK